jgi:chemotaxis protein CheX
MSISPSLEKTVNLSEELLTNQLKHDVKEIFSTMVGLDNLLHLPIKVDPVSDFKDCISGMVGMAGTYNGLASIHMPTELAMRATSSMLGTAITELNDDVNDAIGEMANMIAGSFKLRLSKSGLDIQLSTPSVIFGKEYFIALGNNPKQLAVRFATDDDWFMVVIAFNEN